MYHRNILPELNVWKTAPNRNPLILRGVRQVGKTTVVNLFSSGHRQFS